MIDALRVGKMRCMSSDYTGLTGDVRAIAEVIGRERALYLVGQVVPWSGGERREADVYIPKRPLSHDDLIVRILGLSDAEKLRDALAGETFKLTPCKGVWMSRRDDAMRRQWPSSRLTLKTFAWTFGVSERQARTILGGNPTLTRLEALGMA